MYNGSLTQPFCYVGYAIGGPHRDDDNYLEAEYLSDNYIDSNFGCTVFSLSYDSG